MRKKNDLYIEDFGLKMKIALERRHMSQSELARRMKMSQSMINHYCNDYLYPSLETFIKICVVLDISADFLLFEMVDIGKEQEDDIQGEGNCKA